MSEQCKGCNGYGMVGNILDSDTCPFCKGDGGDGAEPVAVTLPAAPAPTEQAGEAGFIRAAQNIIARGFQPNGPSDATTIGSLIALFSSPDCRAALAARQAPTEAPKEPVACTHQTKRQPHYDHISCPDCGSIHTNNCWGVASQQWFKSVDEARFYQQNGHLPDSRQAPDSRDARQIADLILGNEGMRVTSPVESSTGFGDDIEHRLEIGDGKSRTGVVITLTKLRALKSISQEKAQ